MGRSSPHDAGSYSTTNRPWGNLGPVTPAPQYQPPQPMLPAYLTNAAPETGWYTPGYPASNPTAAAAPSVELDVSDTRFYEQQHGIYTVRIVSTGNIATLDRQLPRIDDVIFEPFDGPVTTTRNGGDPRKQEIVNTYRFRLTPLRDGEIAIPPIHFTGTYATDRQTGQPGKAFNVATRKLTLQVRPAETSVQPWLPLHDLRLQTRQQPEGPLKAGQPVTLTVELTARGAQGNQLPSLADQINGSDFRVYRDATSIKNGIASNGRYLTGSRTETYTLIPLNDGWLHLPNLHIAWWDVDMQQAALAGMPPGSADVRQMLSAAGNTDTARYPLLFWAPMVIAMTLIAGYLLGAWNRSRSLLQRASAQLKATARRGMEHGLLLVNRSSPSRLLQRLRLGVALLMPRPFRIWMCTRCLAKVDDPHTWCAEFKARVCRHLDITSHATLSRIAEEIITASPGTEPARLRRLAQSLDETIYGGGAIDFGKWKLDLQQQLRRCLLPRRRNRSRQPRNRLPALNPLAL